MVIRSVRITAVVGGFAMLAATGPAAALSETVGASVDGSQNDLVSQQNRKDTPTATDSLEGFAIVPTGAFLPIFPSQTVAEGGLVDAEPEFSSGEIVEESAAAGSIIRAPGRSNVASRSGGKRLKSGFSWSTGLYR